MSHRHWYAIGTQSAWANFIPVARRYVIFILYCIILYYIILLYYIMILYYITLYYIMFILYFIKLPHSYRQMPGVIYQVCLLFRVFLMCCGFVYAYGGGTGRGRTGCDSWRQGAGWDSCINWAWAGWGKSDYNIIKQKYFILL